MPDHQAAGRLRRGIQADAREYVLDDAHVILRLLEVLLPLLLEVLVDDAAKGGLVDLHTALFGLERLVQKLVDFLILHGTPPSRGFWTLRVPQSGAERRASYRLAVWEAAIVSNSGGVGYWRTHVLAANAQRKRCATSDRPPLFRPRQS